MAYQKKGCYKYSKNLIKGEWDESTGCLIAKSHFGGKTTPYHQIKRDGKIWSLHRWVFYINNGFLPEVVMHICDNPHCINPHHLKAGTYLTNNQDAKAKGRNSIGERNGSAKLTEKQVLNLRTEIKDRIKNKVKAKDIQKKYGISEKQYKRIRNRTSWGHLDD